MNRREKTVNNTIFELEEFIRRYNNKFYETNNIENEISILIYKLQQEKDNLISDLNDELYGANCCVKCNSKELVSFAGFSWEGVWYENNLCEECLEEIC